MSNKRSQRQLYIAMFKKWLNVTELKVGDYVRIVSDFTCHEESKTGHREEELPSKTGRIGKSFCVIEIEELNVKVKIDELGNPYHFDYRALEPSPNPKEKQTYKRGDVVSNGNTYVIITFRHIDNDIYGVLVNSNLDGFVWSKPALVKNSNNITQEEFDGMCGSEVGNFKLIKS